MPLFGRRKPEKSRYAGLVLDRRDETIARMRRQSSVEGKRIDILSGLIGLMANTEYTRVRNMAAAVVNDLKNELAEIDLSTPEGNKQGLSLQAEIRSMNWFAQGADHLKVELRERKNRKETLQVEIEEADQMERKQQEKEEENRRKQA